MDLNVARFIAYQPPPDNEEDAEPVPIPRVIAWERLDAGIT